MKTLDIMGEIMTEYESPNMVHRYWKWRIINRDGVLAKGKASTEKEMYRLISDAVKEIT